MCRHFVLAAPASMTLALGLTFALTSCGREPKQQPSSDVSEAALAAAANLNVVELSPNGCLDLSLLTERLRSFPREIVIREYTTSFEIARAATDGKSIARLRNMAAESALAALKVDEQSSSAFSNGLAKVTQDGCSTVEFEDELGAKEVHVIKAAASSSEVLSLRSPDGAKEQLFMLKGPRRLEISVMAPKIDRCPDFQKALAISSYSREWGTESELRRQRLKITSGYLRQISIAVKEMPSPLYNLLSRSSGDFIEPEADDLRKLKVAELDPQILRCPFHAKPPSGDEPPPADEHLIPEPQGPTTPLPNPTPEPDDDDDDD